jgi:hypothetical protein
MCWIIKSDVPNSWWAEYILDPRVKRYAEGVGPDSLEAKPAKYEKIGWSCMEVSLKVSSGRPKA